MLKALPMWVRNAVAMLVGMSVVNAGNYAVNIVFGWYLGPAVLGDVVFTTTGLLVLSAGAVALQSTTARAWAASHAAGDALRAARVVREAGWLSLWGGGLLGLCLCACAPAAGQFFQLSSSAPLWWLGALAPLHLLQGVQRGVLQGSERLSRFTRTFQAEMAVRLFGSWLALAFGLDLNGVCAALFASVLVSIWTGGAAELLSTARVSTESITPSLAPSQSGTFRSMLGSALVAQFSVIAFTQTDILVAKARVSPEAAGAFSIVVLTSRIVSFIVQAISAALLPTIVRRAQRGERTDRLLIVAIGAVLLVATPLFLVSWLIPTAAVQALFGPQHVSAAPYLATFVAATTVHGLACVINDYAFFRGVRSANYVSAVAGVCKILLAVQLAHDMESLLHLALLSSIGLLVASGAAAAMALRGLRPGSTLPASGRASEGRTPPTVAGIGSTNTFP